MGNYTGSKKVRFKVVAASVSSVTIGTIGDHIYTGSAIKPDSTVELNGVELYEDTDYSVSYTNNINAGTATVTITGLGNLEGSTSTTFTITQASILGATLSDIAGVTYTGSALIPNVTLKFNSKTLTKNTDYTLTYTNNTNAGTANVVITGKGNFAGARSTVFEITAKNISLEPSIPASFGSIPFSIRI